MSYVGPNAASDRIVKLVEDAQAFKALVQRLADRISGAFLPLAGRTAATSPPSPDPSRLRNPMKAAAALAFSGVSAVTNYLRLRRFAR